MLGINIQEAFLNYLCSVSQKHNNKEKVKILRTCIAMVRGPFKWCGVHACINPIVTCFSKREYIEHQELFSS